MPMTTKELERLVLLTTYTTEELERLTTLTIKAAKPGEFCRRNDLTHLRLVACGRGVTAKGIARWCCGASQAGHVIDATTIPLERRVVSFVDPTELDPPQEVLLHELRHRQRNRSPATPISIAMHGGMKVRSVAFDKTDVGVVLRLDYTDMVRPPAYQADERSLCVVFDDGSMGWHPPDLFTLC